MLEFPVMLGATFTKDHLDKLVQLGGAGLREEDAFIRAAVLRRSELQEGFGAHKARFGIRRPDNERFFQYLVWRGLLESFDFCVEVERGNNYDFVVWHSGQPPIIAVGEMKQWVSPTGLPEIPGIKRDIKKVKASGYPGFILLTTVSERGNLDQQLRTGLCPQLRIDPDRIARYTFETLFEGSTDEREFALLGFMAEDSAIV